MKMKTFIALFALSLAVFFTSCNHCCKPRGSSHGTSLQDTVLPKLMVKLVHQGSSNYLAYYWANSLVVDTTHNPPLLTLMAQSAKYDSVNESFVLHNGATTSQVSSDVSVNTDSVNANYAGPFDPTTGQFCTIKGYLHYKSKTIIDTVICPVASIVYYNQSGSGQPISVGYVSQADLH